jgi:hypothetical protein
MNVSLDEHRLGGLRWIVVRGPDRAAFRALGEHMRNEMAALTKNWGLVTRLRQHVKAPPGRDRLASVRRASALHHPEAWAELAAFAEGSSVPVDDLVLLNVRGDLGPVTGGIGCSDLAWPPPEGTSVARGQTLSALPVPEQDPDPSWFLSVLADAPPPHGVRADPGPGYNATTLCTFIADLTAGQAVIANRNERPVTIPLRDLAEGRAQNN